jgi:hypothetical protein
VQQIVLLLLLLVILSWLPPKVTAFKKAERRKILLASRDHYLAHWIQEERELEEE